MRFLTSVIASLALVGGVAADLRLASQPKNGFRVIDRNDVAFITDKAIYMEPSDFNYAGLKDQRANAYDNFLRSNIDNEQDKRNFNTEAGRDMLPFRSFEGAETDVGQATQQTKIPAAAPGPAISAAPGVATLVPLRWNNPHASELEVNVWVTDNKVVVPVKKPTCSGEGHQDNVFAFTIPTDFNAQLGAKVPGFTGCNKAGDCVLQVYAHSVEARTYAIGVPLIVPGFTASATPATDYSQVEAAKADVGTDLSKLPLDVCLPSNAAAADITSAIPRLPRLASDVFNHAYQNSDYSPYSGQQPEAISKTLQAAAVLSMTTGNRGELGKSVFAQAALAARLEAKQKALIEKYEGITNKIIARLGDKPANGMVNTAALVTPAGTQKEETCFRCLEVGAVTAERLTTNTYVPSFVIPAASLAAAQALVPNQYKQLITPLADGSGGILNIYTATLNDMQADFAAAAKVKVTYQPAMTTKTNTATMPDVAQFKKVNAAGRRDQGQYAAGAANVAAAAFLQSSQIPVAPKKVVLSGAAASTANFVSPFAGVDQSEFSDNEAQEFAAPMMNDEQALYSDSSCDDDATWKKGQKCEGAIQLFVQNPDGSLATTAAFTVQGNDTVDSSTTTMLVIIAAAVAGLLVLVAIIAAAVYVKNKSAGSSARTATNNNQIVTANAV